MEPDQIDHAAAIERINARLDEGEREMKSLKQTALKQTESLQTIADNTAPLLELYADLAAGTKFLCRCAIAVQWVLDKVEQNYKRILILAAIVWAITHNFHLPEWASRYITFLLS